MKKLIVMMLALIMVVGVLTGCDDNECPGCKGSGVCSDCNGTGVTSVELTAGGSEDVECFCQDGKCTLCSGTGSY